MRTRLGLESLADRLAPHGAFGVLLLNVVPAEPPLMPIIDPTGWPTGPYAPPPVAPPPVQVLPVYNGLYTVPWVGV